MAGQADKLMAGELFRVRAKTWNEILDAKDDHQRGKKGRRVQDLEPAPLSSDQILLKNASGGNVAIGSVLQLTTSALDDPPARFAKGHRMMSGTTPDIDVLAPLAVCLVAHPDTKYQPAQISGVCPALVNIISTSHRFATLADNSTALVSAAIGPFTILRLATGTGSQMCLVDLSRGKLRGHGKADEAIAQDATGTISAWAGGTPADLTTEIEAKNWSGLTIDSGARVEIYQDWWHVFAQPLECPA